MFSLGNVLGVSFQEVKLVGKYPGAKCPEGNCPVTSKRFNDWKEALKGWSRTLPYCIIIIVIIIVVVVIIIIIIIIIIIMKN